MQNSKSKKGLGNKTSNPGVVSFVEEFKSNLMLLLHNKYPKGMSMYILEKEYRQLFGSEVNIEMLQVYCSVLIPPARNPKPLSSKWEEALCCILSANPFNEYFSISISHDIESNVDYNIVKCKQGRTDAEMKILAKLASYKNLQVIKQGIQEKNEAVVVDQIKTIATKRKRNQIYNTATATHSDRSINEDEETETYVISTDSYTDNNSKDPLASDSPNTSKNSLIVPELEPTSLNKRLKKYQQKEKTENDNNTKLVSRVIVNHLGQVRVLKFVEFKTFQCNMCGSKLSDEAQLRNHQKDYGIVPGSCQSCSHQFESLCQLKCHLDIGCPNIPDEVSSTDIKEEFISSSKSSPSKQKEDKDSDEQEEIIVKYEVDLDEDEF